MVLWSIALFAASQKPIFDAVDDRALQKVVQEGRCEQNSTLYRQIVRIFHQNRKRLEAKIDTPVIYKKDASMPLEMYPEITLSRKDLNGILAYTHYLECSGDVHRSLAYRKRLLLQKKKVRSDLLSTIIYDTVSERQIVNAFKTSLKHGVYTRAQQCDIASLLSHTLNVDKERFFRGVEIEKAWVLRLHLLSQDEQTFEPDIFDRNKTRMFLKKVNTYKNEEAQRLFRLLEDAMRKETEAALEQYDRQIKQEQAALFSWQTKGKIYTHALKVKLLSLFGLATLEDLDYIARYTAKVLAYAAMPKITASYRHWLKTLRNNRHIIDMLKEQCHGNGNVFSF